MEKYVKIPSGEFYKISYDGTKIEVNKEESVPTGVRVKAFDLIEKIEIVKEESTVKDIKINFFSGSELTTKNESTLDNYINDYMKLLGLNPVDVTKRNDFIQHLKESGIIDEQITYDKYYHKGDKKVELSFENSELKSVQSVYEIPEDANSEEKDIIVKFIVSKDKDGNITEFTTKKLSGSKDIRKNPSEEDIKKVKEELWKTYSVSNLPFDSLSDEKKAEFDKNLASIGVMANSKKMLIKNLNIRKPNVKKILSYAIVLAIGSGVTAAVINGNNKNNNTSDNTVSYQEDYSETPQDDYSNVELIPEITETQEQFIINEPDYQSTAVPVINPTATPGFSQDYVYYTVITTDGNQKDYKANDITLDDLYMENSNSISRICDYLNNPEANPEVGNGICAYYGYSLEPGLEAEYVTYFSEISNEIIRKFYLEHDRASLETYIMDANSAVVQHIRDDYPFTASDGRQIRYSELSPENKRWILKCALNVNEVLSPVNKTVDVNGESFEYDDVLSILIEEWNNVESLSK